MQTARIVLLMLLIVSAAGGQEPPEAAAPLVITEVTVVDVRNGKLLPNRTVVIEAGRISRIEPSAATRAFPGALVIEARGKFLIPGLWDMHYHFQRAPNLRELNMLVANGVLGIRDMGDRPDEIFRARDEIAAGKLLGPQIVACGPIVDGPNPSNPPISIAVGNPEEARRTVQSLKAQGADCIKVHDLVPLDAYKTIAEEARKAGLPLVGHIPIRVRTLQAAVTGQRSVEHQIGLRGTSTVEDEVMESEKTADVFAEAMRTKNFQLIPESIAKKGNYLLDHFDQRLANQLYRAFARRGLHLDPTLVTDRSLTFVDDLNKQPDPRMKYIPASQREWWNPERGMLTRYRTPAYIAFRKRQFEKTLEQIPVAHRLGVKFLAGTDASLPFVYPGFSVHDELALFVQAGLTPLQALQTATINPAAFLGMEQRAGTVRPGRLANLVLLDADPLREIRNTKRIHAVILRGKLVSRGDLDAMLEAAEAAAKN